MTRLELLAALIAAGVVVIGFGGLGLAWLVLHGIDRNLVTDLTVDDRSDFYPEVDAAIAGVTPSCGCQFCRGKR